MHAALFTLNLSELEILENIFTDLSSQPILWAMHLQTGLTIVYLLPENGEAHDDLGSLLFSQDYLKSLLANLLPALFR